MEERSLDILGKGDGLVITVTGLALPEDLTFEDWLSIGLKLHQMEKSVQWWIGDWLRFGERKYGVMYKHALATTDYKYRTLRIVKYVADRFELFRRRNNLS